MSDQEFMDYKSKYIMLYRKTKIDREVVSVLDDVDFCIELMETNRINVAYIMNLIRNITFENGKPRHEDVEHIKRELDRSDNMQLHKKIDILKAFLDEVVMGLDGTQDIDAEYDEFENKQKQAEIESFATSEDIDVKMLNEFISEYSFSGVLNQGEVRDRIEKPMPLLKKKSLVTRIVEFIKSHVSKYSS